MKIRELYNQAFKEATLMSPSEQESRWSQFGMLVYREFLEKEDTAIREKNKVENDIRCIIAFIPKKERAEMKKILHEEFFGKYFN